MIRPPSPDIRQWDVNACETACTAQLLYMHGLLEPEDAPSLDRYVGRQRGQADLTGGNIRLLLERGFVIREFVGTFDSERAVGPQGIEYVRESWRKAGHPEKKIDEHLPLVYPLLRRRLLMLRKLESESSGRYVTIVKKPTLSDFLEHISKVPVSITWREDDGTGHMTLVTRRVRQTTCELYDPDPLIGGTIDYVTISGLEQCVKSGFRAFFRP